MEWYLNKKLHREGDQPSVVKNDGTKEWYWHGERHREGDQPAIVKSNGTLEWYLNGKHHREDGQPAVINSMKGVREWYIDGSLYKTVRDTEDLSDFDQSLSSFPNGIDPEFFRFFDIKQMYLNLLGLDRSPNRQFDKFIKAYINILKNPKFANALSFYTNYGDKLINPYLRKGQFTGRFNLDKDTLMELISTLNQIMEKIPPIGIRQTVWRGMYLGNDIPYKVGDPIDLMYKGFNSASYSPITAKKFVQEGLCCQFEMVLPTNVKGLCLVPVSHYPNETEFLLAPGYLFKVSQILKDDIPVMIILECTN